MNRECWSSSMSSFPTITSFFREPFPDKEEIWESSWCCYPLREAPEASDHRGICDPIRYWFLHLHPNLHCKGDKGQCPVQLDPRGHPFKYIRWKPHPQGFPECLWPRPTLYLQSLESSQPKQLPTCPHLAILHRQVTPLSSSKGTLETSWAPMGFKVQVSVRQRMEKRKRTSFPGA